MSYAKPNVEQTAPSLTVNLPSRTIEFFSGDNLLKEYPIAIGKSATPTPLGSYSIICKEINPAWYPPDKPGKVVPSGPSNPLGFRWMGFWNNYGIHGTNAPWSIGNAVSNGCIRMYEEDVEELFDKVNYGTRVRVTYDRVKVRTDAAGQMFLSVYPDVYGYGSITVQDIRNKLSNYQLNDFVTDEFLRKMIDDPSDRQVAIARQFKISVKGKLTNERGLVVQEVPHVPLNSFAKVLNQAINWDEQNKTARCGAVSVPGIVVGSEVYISTANATKLFRGEQNWKVEENTWDFDKLMVFLNEKPVQLEVNEIRGILAVPVIPLAESMGRKVKWVEESKNLIISDKGQPISVPVDLVGAVPYIKITDINQYFGAYVYWNELAKTIELTYP